MPNISQNKTGGDRVKLRGFGTIHDMTHFQPAQFLFVFCFVSIAAVSEEDRRSIPFCKLKMKQLLTAHKLTL